MRLLNIVSSPRGAKSVSIAVANAFLDAYCTASPSTEVDTLNVWEENLPDFDSQAIGAKYKGVSKEPMDSSELSIWLRIQSLVKRFQEADRIVLGVPMWNFAYPYKLKQLIDLVSQRNMLFTFDGKIYGPMLKVPRALVIYVRGQSHDRGEGISSPGVACARASGPSKCCVQNKNMGCKVVTLEMSRVMPCLGRRAAFQSR